MKKGDLKKKKGFTIIEVSLVLAIAGLIFLMVFVALPQLQRQQRDARRKDDIMSFLETVKKYQTNNRGALPVDWSEGGDFQTKYLDDAFMDPDGTNYRLQEAECATNGDAVDCSNSPILNSMDHTLYILEQATCDGGKAIRTSNPRNVAVVYRLEGSGMYCANTQLRGLGSTKISPIQWGYFNKLRLLVICAVGAGAFKFVKHGKAGAAVGISQSAFGATTLFPSSNIDFVVYVAD